jgi:hypothetical protein
MSGIVFRQSVIMLLFGIMAVTAQAQTSTITGTANGPNGSDDNWNLAANWDAGIPSGTANAVVAPSVLAQVDSAVPIYSGTLTLNTGSEVRLANRAGVENALTGASTIFLGTNSSLRLRTATYPAPITLTGDINKIYSLGDHQSFTLTGAISGSHALTLNGRNNITFTLGGNSDFSGGLITSGSGWRVVANANNALGAGDVTINSGVTLQVDVAEAIGDGATLTLNGAKDSRKATKLILNASDTINAFVIDGVDQCFGDFDSSTHPGVISGSGTLTVTVPPGDDDLDGEPNATDCDPCDNTVYPGAPEICDGKDNDCNGIVDDGLVGCVNTMAATGEWALGANWSLGTMPVGAQSAVVNSGVAATASVDPVFAYTGELTLNSSATLSLRTSQRSNAMGTNVNMHTGSTLSVPQATGAGSTTFPTLNLLGSATVSAGGHHYSHNFNGVISGSGGLTFTGGNNNTFELNTANTFTGGFTIQNGNCRVDANANGVFSTGDLSINNAASLRISTGLTDTIDDAASVFLVGAKDAKLGTDKLDLTSSETIFRLFIEGVQQPGGTYTDSESWLSSLNSSTLTVLDWPVSMTNNSAVNVGTTVAELVSTLDAPNEIFDIYAYWSTNDNADSTAWLADVAASNALVGSYSNIVSITNGVSLLTPATTYYYTMTASNALEQVWASLNATFITPGLAAAPTVTIGGGATNIGVGTATLQGLMTAGGAADAYICWGESDGGTTSTGNWENVTSLISAIETVPFSTDVSGLYYGVEYDYRVYVTNGVGDDWSGLATFTTLAPISNPGLPVTANLVAHYDAGVGVTSDGSGVLTWEDQSGNGYDATRQSGTPTLVTDALNSLPEIQCRNKNSYFNVNYNIFVKEQYVVGRAATATWNNYGAYFANKSGRPGSYLFQSGNTGFHNNAYPSEVSRDGVVKSISTSGTLTPMQDYMVLKVVVNTGNTTPRQYYVGRSDHSTADLDVLEIIGYGTTLSDAEEDEVGGYLAYKYGITTTYPAFSPPAALGITNTAAANLTDSSADLIGTLDATQSVFTVYAYYSKINNADATAWRADGSATSVPVGTFTNVLGQSVSVSVGSLDSTATYYYTMLASNVVTEIWASPNATFDTLAPAVAPVVTIGGGATEIGIGSATLRGLLTAGISADAYICWGASDGGNVNTGNWDNVVDAGIANDGVTFSNAVSGLLYGLEYSYRVYATNAAGEDWSGLDTFTTLAPPPGASGMIAPGGLTVTCSDDFSDRFEIDAFNGNGLSGDTHNNVSGDMWLSNGGVANEWLKVGLGGTYDLDYLRVWNYNESGGTYWRRGINQCDIYVATSDPGVNTDDSGAAFSDSGWTLTNQDQIFSPADGSSNITNTDPRIEMSGASAAYLAIRVDSNHSGDGYVGLSEMHIYYSTPDSIGIENTSAANIASTTADLEGSLDATQAVFTVTVYYSTNNNADSAAWMADGSKSSQVIDTYTNVLDHALSASVGGLDPLTTYYYTMHASNAATNLWASPNASFTTFANQVAPTVDNAGGATAVIDIAATLNGNMSAGGLAAAYMVWGGSVPGSPEDTNAWANLEPIGNVGDGSVFSTNITGLTAETIYYYRCFVTNAVGGAWSIVTNFTTTESVNTMTVEDDNTDDWNTGSNWDKGHAPTGAENALVDTGLYADVNNAATPAYAGTLTLRAGATIRVQSGTSPISVPFGGAAKTITLNAGSTIVFGTGSHTLTQPIVLTGNAKVQGGYSTTGHHTTRGFGNTVDGPGQLTLVGVNNNTFPFNASNSFNGLRTSNGSGSNFRIDANVSGALGVGDVSITNTASLRLFAADAISDTATLSLDGGRDTKLSATYDKLHLTVGNTVSNLFIDALHKQAGVYDNTEAWLSGAGTLTVLDGPPPTPPEIDPSDFVDDVFGGPIYADHPYYPITYTLTFDRDMDDTTVDAADFENGGTATIAVGTITETSDGVFDVQVTPSGSGTLILQITNNAVLKEAGGASLDTSSAIADDTTITIIAGSPPLTTISGTAGGTDSWNTSGNWDNGVPYGNQSAAVTAGLLVQVGGASRPYAGDLTFGAGSTLRVNAGTDVNVLPSAGGTITLLGSATFDMLDAPGWGSGFVIYPDVVLGGNLLIDNRGNGSHHETRVFSGAVSGTGGITMDSDNNNILRFSAANTFSGGVTMINANSYLEATADGALGIGSVTIGNATSLKIGSGRSDSINDHASLNLNGTKDGGEAAKVVMGSSETIKRLYLDGTLQDRGTYGAISSGADNESATFSGSGILTVLNGPPRTIFLFK